MLLSEIHRLSLSLLFLTAGASAFADENLPSNDEHSYPIFQFSGFLSLIGGQVIDGNARSFDYSNSLQNCPCFIADWTNSGVYNSNWSFEPESRLGGQMTIHMTDNFSFTTQALVRAVDPDLELAWAYFNYQLNDHWSVQLGRKRIPNFFYSDFQDIGVAYPWISVPPALYGWEVTNFNGGTVRYNNNLSGFDVTTSLFAGSEKVDDSRFNRLSYGYTGFEINSRAEWNHLAGIDLEINKRIWTARLIYLQADAQSVYKDGHIERKNDLSSYGIANNFDFDHFFILSEITESTRSNGFTNHQHAASLGAGYRINQWSLFINQGDYKDSYNYKIDNTSITLRYDLDAHSDIKAQFDRMEGDPHAYYTGDTTVFRISYDTTF